MTHLQSFAVQFAASTRRYLFIRPEDGVLILRPNKVHHWDGSSGWKADNRMDGLHPLIRFYPLQPTCIA